MGKSKILSEQEFKEKTRDLDGMEYIEYIKKYCDKKLSNFKLDPVYFEQTAYHDVTYYKKRRPAAAQFRRKNKTLINGGIQL